MSTMHLGKPHRFYRGFNNLRHSPVSREGLGIAVFIGCLGLHILASLPGNAWFQALWRALFGADIGALAATSAVRTLGVGSGLLALLGAATGLYYMNRCYRIPARPFWNHWQVATAFGGSVLALGSLLAGAVVLGTLAVLDAPRDAAALVFGTLLTAGLAIEGIGHVAHAKAMGTAAHEGGASYYIQTTTFGKTYTLRNTLLGVNLLVALGLLTVLAVDGASAYTLAGWALVGAVTIITSLIGRALFYVLVIPTTMPGAFFWKNKGFEEHARQIGLARLPQVGVAPLRH
jgi:DMSO reductase anchor subunit